MTKLEGTVAVVTNLEVLFLENALGIIIPGSNILQYSVALSALK